MLCDGRLQGFAIVHLTLYGGQWREVARADCAHGTVHVDLLHRRRKTKHVRTLRVINSERDLDEGFTEAWADLEDNLDEHLRRWKA